ncbi:MAG: COR domain-containing protein [Bacteroidota bacterium]|uniref:COR domain-containing protein n=1 Tax=Runella sp. TaxID=1960881 RepID=UPI003015CD93
MYQQQITAQKIDAFCGKGESGLYRDFAMHAAVLWVFNADLLYQMRANFRQDEQGKPMPVPQEAVADLLLSSLVESLGQGWFEFDPAARELLLTEITNSSRFGKTRLDDLSDFLLQYLDRRPNAKGLENGVFAEMLHWNALMHVRPQEAAERIGLALREGSEQKNAFQPIRIQQIYEKIMLPVRHQPQFKNLELYIDGAAQLALERRGAAAKAFDQVNTAEMQFGKIILKVPKLKPIKTKFELPSGILHAAMLADGKWIAAGMYNGSVALVNLISGEIKYKEVSKSDVNSVRLKENKLLVACLDGQVYVFDWTKAEWEQLLYHKFEEAVWTAEFDEEGDRFLLGMASGNVEMWRLSWKDLERRFYAHKKDVMEAQFAQISEVCISISLDQTLILSRFSDKEIIASFRGERPYWTFAQNPITNEIAIGEENGYMTIVKSDFTKIPIVKPSSKRAINQEKDQIFTLPQLESFQAHTQTVRSISWLPYKDIFVLLSSSTDGGILVHSTEGELLHTIQPPGSEQAMCVQIVEDKIMTATGSTLNIIPVQSVWTALDKGQKPEAPRQEKDTVTYSEIILYVVSNVNSNTGETNFGLLKDLFNESLNSTKIDEDVYDLDVAGMTLRLRLWEVLPSELQKGLHRIYMSSGSVCLFVQNSDFDPTLVTAVEAVTSNVIVIDQNMLLNIYERRTAKGFDLYQVIRENLRVKEMNRPEQLSSFQGSFSNSEPASSDILMRILPKSPGFGEEVPRAWVKLKNVLQDEGQNTNTIDKAYYLNLCEQQNVDDPNSALDFLHKTGSISHLKLSIIGPVIILNVKWLVSQCIKTLTSGKYQLAVSDFQLKDPFIVIQTLRALKTVLQTENGIILIPDIFPETAESTLQLSQTACPTRVFQYEHPIQNIHYQIFAQYFTSLKPDSLSQNGAVITKGKAQVAVILDKTARTISLLIDGPGSGALRQEIETKIEETNSIEHLTAVKNVPCICSQCLSDKKPTLYPYNELIDFQSKGETNVQCTKSRALVAIQDLLALEPAKIRIQTLIETYTKISNADEKRMLELLEGKDDPARIEWLEKGLVAYQSVCKVINIKGEIGTGFLINHNTILTCNHCIRKQDIETGATIEFTEINQPANNFSYALSLANFESSPTEILNFSKINVLNTESKPLTTWGFIPTDKNISVHDREPVFMIRYHEGHIKEIDFSPSVIISSSSDFIYYSFYKKSFGSSGGPIFNINWDCIGMHLASQGSESGGMLISEGMPKEPARKGVRIKAISEILTFNKSNALNLTAQLTEAKHLLEQNKIQKSIESILTIDNNYNLGNQNEIKILKNKMSNADKKISSNIILFEEYLPIKLNISLALLSIIDSCMPSSNLEENIPSRESDLSSKNLEIISSDIYQKVSNNQITEAISDLKKANTRFNLKIEDNIILTQIRLLELEESFSTNVITNEMYNVYKSQIVMSILNICESLPSSHIVNSQEIANLKTDANYGHIYNAIESEDISLAFNMLKNENQRLSMGYQNEIILLENQYNVINKNNEANKDFGRIKKALLNITNNITNKRHSQNKDLSKGEKEPIEILVSIKNKINLNEIHEAFIELDSISEEWKSGLVTDIVILQGQYNHAFLNKNLNLIKHEDFIKVETKVKTDLLEIVKQIKLPE